MLLEPFGLSKKLCILEIIVLIKVAHLTFQTLPEDFTECIKKQNTNECNCVIT